MSNDAPYIMWHVDDYLGDTTHLTTVEHGAYMLTMFACWKRGGSMPEKHVERTVRMTPEQWAESRDTLAEFFVIEDGVWTHSRIVAEIERIEAKRKTAKRAGKASAKARRATAGKPATPASQPTETTTVERTLNECPTPVEQPINHVDVEVDVKKEHPPHPSDGGGDTSGREQTPPSTGGEWLLYLCSTHGLTRTEAFTPKARKVADLWHAAGYSTADVDAAVKTAQEQASGRPGPVYIDRVLASNRDKAGKDAAKAKASAANHTGFANRDYHNDPWLARFNGKGVAA